MHTPSSESAPSVSVEIDPALTNVQDPFRPGYFSTLAIDGVAAGQVLRDHGLDDPAIRGMRIVADTDTPSRGIEQPGAPETFEYATIDAPGIVSLHPKSTVITLAQNPPPDRLPANQWEAKEHERIAERREVARDLSSRLVEALSREADRITMGEAGLEAERDAAFRAVAVRKSIPRALGALAATGTSALVVYANNKWGSFPETVVDVAAGVTTIACWILLRMSARTAALTEKADMLKRSRLPVDIRARQRAERYRRDCGAGAIPELVTYQLSAAARSALG